MKKRTGSKKMSVLAAWLLALVVVAGLVPPMPVAASSPNLSIGGLTRTEMVTLGENTVSSSINLTLTNNAPAAAIITNVQITATPSSGLTLDVSNPISGGTIVAGTPGSVSIPVTASGLRTTPGTDTFTVDLSVSYSVGGVAQTPFSVTATLHVNVTEPAVLPPPDGTDLHVNIPSIQIAMMAGAVDVASDTFRVIVTNPTGQAISGVTIEAVPSPGIIVNDQLIRSGITIPAGGEHTETFSVTVVGITQSTAFPVAFRISCPAGAINATASFVVTVVAGPPQPTTPIPTTTPAPPPIAGPSLHLLSPQIITLAPGEVHDVQVTLRNNGGSSALDVLTTILGGGAAPFTVQIVDGLRINSIPSNQERTLTLRISVDADATPGPNHHTVNLSHAFRTPGQDNTTNTTQFSIRIGGAAVAHAPRIQLGNFNGLATAITPGQTFTVTAEVTNAGQGVAHDVQITFPSLPSNIILTSNLNDALIATLNPGQTRTLTFAFQVSGAASAGTLNLDFRAAFNDENGRPQEAVTTTRFVNIASTDVHDGDLQFQSITAPSGRFAPGRTANFSVVLHNSGTTTLTNIAVTATPPSGINPMTQTTHIVPSLAPGATQTITFGFTPGQHAGNHTHTIRFDADFRVNGQAAQINQFAALNVTNPDAGDEPPADMLRRPWIVIDDFFTDPPLIVRAGQDFTLTMTFRNTSEIDPIYNARIVLTPIGGGTGPAASDVVFIPTGGSSNTIFIDHIPAGATVTKEMHFFTVGDAMPRSYTVRVDMSYQAPGFAQPLTDDVNISIRVSQFTRLETQPVTIWIPPTASVGDPIFVEFQPVNTGRVDINGLRIRIEENNMDPDLRAIDASQFDDFIGALQPNRWLMYRGMFVPLVPGPLNFDIILYGEDPANDPVEHRIPFEMYIFDPFGGGGSGWDDPWMNEPWDPGFNPGWPGDDFIDSCHWCAGWDPYCEWCSDPEPEDEPGLWRRFWRWWITPIGGHAGVRRNNGNNGNDDINDPRGMPQFRGKYIDDNADSSGFALLGGVVSEVVVISPGGGGGGMVVGRPQPMPPGGGPQPPGGENWGDDYWGDTEEETDGFFIGLWNFVRMPVFLFPFGIAVGVGITLLVKKVKANRDAEMDFDE
ncbi:MAG: NEW3 domain-containing protein [Defluviitaleaceae bacterium]|nr:NEW3 domain-containing protein [Defluviitaleaceae bacterium]